MWILPEQLHTLVCAPGMPGLTEGLAEQSQLLAQSLLVRSKVTQSQTWSQKWKREPWTRLLFGRILRPSHGGNFVAAWMSSAGDSPASHGATPASESGTKTPAICSHTYSKESRSADPQLCFWKTSRELSAPNSQATDGPTLRELPYCSMSLESWNEQATLARGDYSARLKSARLTSESESSSCAWNTPRVSTAGDCPSERNRHSPSLESQANWYTPDCSDRRSAGSRQQGLSNQVTEWPTIRAQEPGATSEGYGRGLAELVEGKEQTAGPQDPTSLSTPGNPPELFPRENCSSANSKPSNWSTPIAGDWKGQVKKDGSEQMLCAQVTKFQAKGQLNPRWVELLMGLPVGWTRPSASIQELTNSDC